MTEATNKTGVIGLLTEFASKKALIDGVQTMRKRLPELTMETYSPYPIEEVDEILARPRSRLPLAMFCGGLAGACGAYFMEYYAMAIDYPLNVGGRPLHSWPAFIPVAFELTVLGAALTGFFGMLFAARLPRPHHPVFNAIRFRAASQDRFFLLVHAPEGMENWAKLRSELQALRPDAIIDLYE